MDLPTVLQKSAGIALTLCGGWVACVVLCASTSVQRHVCYLHKLPIWWSQKLQIPESFGFLHNQVLPLYISTSDKESLYAWLVTPLALYARHEEQFLRQNDRRQSGSDIAIELLRDPQSQLVIYFHGNAGTVGQTRRTDAYRTITSGASERLHVLAFDYRGFGKSSGSPTEAGLVDDALSVIKWATNVGKVPTERIILVAQSLGTAVAVAAVEVLTKESPDTKFAGICLCAAFTDAASIFTSYKLGGWLPLLYPLEMVPVLRAWFANRIRDKWLTKDRLERIVRQSGQLHLTLVAAITDEVIPWHNTETLFETTIGQVSGARVMDREHINDLCQRHDLGEGGAAHEWTDGKKCIRKVIVQYGGHNGIMKWAPVALEVFRMSAAE